jgi:hypothetical protein
MVQNHPLVCLKREKGRFERSGKSRILSLLPTPFTETWFCRAGARWPDTFAPLIDYLWVRRAVIVEWYRWRHGLDPAFVPAPALHIALSSAEPHPVAGPAQIQTEYGGRAGRPETYDWVSLKELLKTEIRNGTHFTSKVKLAEWCIDRVAVRPEMKGQDSGPDLSTAKAAIRKHGLDEIAGLKGCNQG